MQYTLKNQELTATFKTAGAELTSLQDTRGKEYIWCGDASIWNRHSPVLFPFVGKVNNGEYRYKGVAYKMGQHGFARDAEFALELLAEDEIWFVLDATEETKQKYPFEFRLEVGYKLIGNTLRVMWKVKNPSDNETLYFSIGAHPAFMCPIEEGTKRTDYYLQLKGDAVNEKDAIIYYTPDLEKGLRLNEKCEMKLENGRVLMPDGFFSIDTYIIEDSQVSEVALVTPEGRPYVTVSFDAPVVGIWSPEAKQAPFVCIEPWYGRCDRVDFKGCLEEREWGNTLAAGESFEAHYDICIER